MNKLTIPPTPNWFEANVVTCAPDNTLIYGSTGDLVVIYPDNRDEAARVRLISNAHERVIAVSTNNDWNTDSKLLVSIGDEKVVRLWDLNTFELKNSHNVHKQDKKSSKLAGVAFATDDRIVSVAADGLVVLWRPSLNATTSFTNLIPDKSHVTCVSICPHATWLAAFGLSKGIVVVADLRKSGKVLHNLRCFDISPIISLSWCPVPVNIFPENKRLILTPKSKLDKKLTIVKNDDEKENVFISELDNKISSTIIKKDTHDVDVDQEIKKPVPKLEDYISSDLIQIEENSSFEVIAESRKPTSSSFTKESREQILNELANLSLNKEESTKDNKNDETVQNTALNSKNVKENPWVNLKHVDDDELNDSQDTDPRAALVPDKTVTDEFDFLSECTALKYRILGERDLVESEDVDDDFYKNDISANKEIKTDESFDIEADKVLSNIEEENLVPLRKDFLLASSSKSGPICIWRAGTDGRIQLELQSPNKRRDNRKDYRKPTDKAWITIFWIKPHILLSSSVRGELIQWDLLKYKGNGRDHRSSIVHFDHRNLLFTISGKRVIPSSLQLETKSNDEALSVWTTGQDKQIFEVVLDSERTCISSYLTFAVVNCISGSTIDPNRFAMGHTDSSIIVWNLSLPHKRRITMNRFYHKSNAKITSLAWHPMIENLIGYATSEGAVATLTTNNTQTGITFLSSFFKSPVHKVEWGPLKGDKEKYVLYVCGEGKLVYYDINNGQKAPVPIDLDDEYITHMSWKPDYSVLAIGTKSNAIILLSASFEILSSVFVAQKTIIKMSWHPMATLNSICDESKCCNWLAIATIAGQCAVYNMICDINSKGKSSLVHELKGHSKPISSISWSPYDDGKLATSSEDCTAQIWNVETGTILNSYISTNVDPITNILWSPLKENLIICTAKDLLEIWDMTEHGPKSHQEIDESLKSLLKNKNKYYSRIHQEKKSQIIQIDGARPEKAKIISLLPTLTKAQNDVVQALSDCRNLLEKSEHENNSVMQFFGDKDNVLKMLTNQQNQHMKCNKPEFAQHLSLWKGDLSDTIRSAIENGTVTPWLICLTPMVSPQLWQSACRSYAMKQSEESSDSDPTVTASFFLACHDIEAAINVLSEAKLFREAIAIIKSRLIENSEIYNKLMTDIMDKWAMSAIITGLFEIAAQCYIYLEKYDEAAKALFKRSDVKSLQLAMDLANKSENAELILAIKTRLDLFEKIPESEMSEIRNSNKVEVKSADSLVTDEPKLDGLVELEQLKDLIESTKLLQGEINQIRSEVKGIFQSLTQERSCVNEEVTSLNEEET